MSDERDNSDAPEPSVTDLVEQLARDTGRLAAHEAALGASRHVPELRQVALGAGLGVAALLAFLTAFALGNWAAVAGLSTWLAGWLAALLVAAAWLVVGVALVALLRSRVRRGRAGVWLRIFGDKRRAAVAEVQASRDEAEQAVRASLDQLGAAVAAASAAQLADAVVPFAGNLGDELLDEADEALEAVADAVPGGRAIGQVVDIVLLPGRVGLRIATTVLGVRSDEPRR